MFKLSSFNRDVRKTKALEESFRRHGWIDAYPMHVHQNGGRQYIIKAGHHRFYVAQKLGIPVKFVISNDKATIHELERSTTNWGLNDYLVSYCRQGKKDYLQVKDYCDETGIPLTDAISMLGGHAAGSNNLGPFFKDGTFTVKKPSHANTVRDIVLYLKKYGVVFAHTDLLVKAISKVSLVPDFDPNHLKQKIKLFSSLIEKKANLDQYLDMLEDLYNRQSRSKIPLKFMANEEAKRRNAVKKS
jgi:hypothetical protein